MGRYLIGFALACCAFGLAILFCRQEKSDEVLSSTAHVECVKKNGRIGRENKTIGLHPNVKPIGKGEKASMDKDALKSVVAVPDEASRRLDAQPVDGTTTSDLAQAASEKNQVMAELLNQDQLPAAFSTGTGAGLLTVDRFHTFTLSHFHTFTLRAFDIFKPDAPGGMRHFFSNA